MAAPPQPATRGFYVFQTGLGSPLQFHPALGTCELDALMDAYLPSPTTIQEKRASVSVDFFDHYRCTGESIKFYQVPDRWVSSATSSPNSAQDSGYGSSFNASPLAPTWSWGPAFDATAASTPSTSSSASTPQITSRKQPSSKKQSTSSRANLTDLSSLPGMKILTRDGRDVTNTATRGCKTKEQRDHAHLMRIMKACDSCRRKKVRCNPSHRSLAGPASPTEQSPRSVKKAKISDQACKPAVPTPYSEPAILGGSTSSPSLSGSFNFDSFDLLQDVPADEQASWDEFLRFNGELDSMFPDSFGFLPDLPMSLQSTPPGRTAVSSSVVPNDTTLAHAQQPDVPAPDMPMLPYVERNREPHNYMDFNLYSPSSSFSDAEPAIAGDLLETSISRRTEAAEPQRGDALFSERLAGSAVYRPEVCLDTRWLDQSENSRSSLLQTWLSTSSQSVPSPNSVCFPAHRHRRPRLTTSQITTRHIPTSAGDEAVSATAVGFSDASTKSVQVGFPNANANSLQTAVDKDPSSPVLRLARLRDGSADFSPARAVNRKEPSVPASVSAPPQRFVTTHHDASTETSMDGQRFSKSAVRRVAPGDRNRGFRHIVESPVVQPSTAEPPAGERTEHKHLRPRAAAPRLTALANSAVGGQKSEEPRLVIVPKAPTVCEGSTTSDVMPTSPQEARASVTMAGVSVCQAASEIRWADTRTDGSTWQEWASPVTTSKSQPDVMSVRIVAAMAFALAAVWVYGISSNVMWTLLCTVMCTIAQSGQATDDSASSARKLHTRRYTARVGTVFNRISVLV